MEQTQGNKIEEAPENTGELRGIIGTKSVCYGESGFMIGFHKIKLYVYYSSNPIETSEKYPYFLGKKGYHCYIVPSKVCRNRSMFDCHLEGKKTFIESADELDPARLREIFDEIVSNIRNKKPGDKYFAIVKDIAEKMNFELYDRVLMRYHVCAE